MSVEHLNPGSVEGYDDFETAAFGLQSDLQAELDNLVETGQPLMDEDFEQKSLTLLKLTDSLGRLFFHEFDVDMDEAIATSHCAFYFGLLLGRQLNPGKEWGFDLSELQQFDDPLEFKEFIERRADSYLQYRKTIDGLIGRYMPVISPNPQLEAGAETIVAFALAQVELEHFDNFVTAEIADSASYLDDLETLTEE
ncbi:MAG TPA: hypothetical protein VFG56_01765 [Candidatus Saccharimonadales bacterium]|nr:hypothetical protein [Candidatus Saccharimonadales bacterium]